MRRVSNLRKHLLAWIEHAADWELKRHAGLDYQLQPPEAAIRCSG